MGVVGASVYCVKLMYICLMFMLTVMRLCYFAVDIGLPESVMRTWG
jgi:hypothetical protein